MVGVENTEHIISTLAYAKEKYNLQPKLVVVDLSPCEIAAVSDVFGIEVLQIDGFHVMQELNNGIRADLAVFRDKTYRKQIKELISLREKISKIQKGYKEKQEYEILLIQSLCKEKSKFTKSQLCIDISREALTLFPIIEPKSFIQKFKNLLITWNTHQDPAIQTFYSNLTGLIPKRNLTDCGCIRIKQRILQVLKTVFATYRKELEDESITFFHEHWVLLFQPERMNPERELLLANFLAKYPSLEEYRKITLQVGSIYRKPIEDIDGSEIELLINKPEYTEKLQTAINTLKKWKDSIIRFVDVYKTDPKLGKSGRASMEPINRNFKAPFHKGLNCTKRDHILGKLNLQMGCEVRWLLDAPHVV